ncbi:hypothetical protein Tsubulata_041481 [Turnera subulata]|uniref:Dirigent protein n=1 Tax=Turnera subulata TaxID=218843 RepID=A0A9Q0G8H3_9ROSI|nr:hypothetical protein Tsubulata_041481 [Turnera subulata]
MYTVGWCLWWLRLATIHTPPNQLLPAESYTESDAGSSDGNFSRNLSPKSLGLKREKLTHLHFYFHDIVTAQKDQNKSTAKVGGAAAANGGNSSWLTFGNVVMMDNALTTTPDFTSKLVGRAEGIYASASQSETSLLMVLNFFFTQGKFNGSTLSVLGRNPILSSVREMPIVGGTGVFRFSRGYALARTYSFDPSSFNAVVGYDVYVLHY